MNYYWEDLRNLTWIDTVGFDVFFQDFFYFSCMCTFLHFLSYLENSKFVKIIYFFQFAELMKILLGLTPWALMIRMTPLFHDFFYSFFGAHKFKIRQLVISNRYKSDQLSFFFKFAGLMKTLLGLTPWALMIRISMTMKHSKICCDIFTDRIWCGICGFFFPLALVLSLSSRQFS